MVRAGRAVGIALCLPRMWMTVGGWILVINSNQVNGLATLFLRS